MKAVSPGWFGSCFTLFCLAEQTAPGRTAHSPPRQAGWPGRRGYRGSPFFFCFVPSEWGQLLLSGALCLPSGETVQDPPAPNNFPSLLFSLTHAHPSISSARSAEEGRAEFCGCPGERAVVQPEEERTFIVSVARQKRFLSPLRGSLQASVCVCVNNCLRGSASAKL